MNKGFKKKKVIDQKKLGITIRTSDIDYKNYEQLAQFISNRYKLLSRKISGLSAKKQRKLQVEVKKARILGLLPFTDRHSISQ